MKVVCDSKSLPGKKILYDIIIIDHTYYYVNINNHYTAADILIMTKSVHLECDVQ